MKKPPLLEYTEGAEEVTNEMTIHKSPMVVIHASGVHSGLSFRHTDESGPQKETHTLEISRCEDSGVFFSGNGERLVIGFDTEKAQGEFFKFMAAVYQDLKNRDK